MKAVGAAEKLDEADAPTSKVVKLKKPIAVGEGDAKKTIAEINLEGLGALTGADVMFCRREATGKTGQPVIYGTLDDAYRLEVAAKVSGLSVESLMRLGAQDFEEVDSMVKSFLMGLASA